MVRPVGQSSGCTPWSSSCLLVLAESSSLMTFPLASVLTMLFLLVLLLGLAAGLVAREVRPAANINPGVVALNGFSHNSIT